jgi:NADPH:quinone reductase-like Zn-dependent oxidoreductase
MRYFCIDKYFGNDALVLEQREKPVPTPGHGQVLVRILAASLNYRDLLVLSGSYSRNLPIPLIPLSDGAGEVVETGPGVRRWKPGDRVAGTFFQEWDAGGITEEAPKSAMGGQ